MLSRDLRLRAAVALVGGPLLLAATFTGGIYYFLVVLVIAVRGQWELIRLLAPPQDGAVVRWLGVLVGAGLVTDAWLTGGQHWGAFLLAGTVAVLVELVLHPELPTPGSAAGSAVLSWAYVAAPLAHLIWLREGGGIFPDASGSAWLAIALWALIWGSDTAAYFTGVTWGRHRLAPLISPKKSVEGTVGGILASGIIGILLAAGVPALDWTPLAGAGLGVLIGASAVLGDLMESRLKRGAGAKDAGEVLPGHGGMLDRFDSTILCAPVLYYVLVLLGWTGGVG